MIFDRNDIDYSFKEDQDTTKQFESFDIVLVDIHQTVAKRSVHSVKKRLEPGADLKYVAISYRWGEYDEILLPTTDYEAHITSFRLNAFVSLCDVISKERDLKSMQYVWVDAICVDQANETRRKETIYRMNEIYTCSKYIIAVPDLNQYSGITNISTVMLDWMKTYAEYLYHLIMNNANRVGELDDRWIEAVLKVPRNLRCYLSTTNSKSDPIHMSVMNVDSEKILFENFMIPEHICPQSPPSSLEKKFRSLSSTMGLHKQEQPQMNNQQDIYQWQRRQLVGLFHLQRQIDKRHDLIRQILDFLEDLISDWSKRAWVISEYNIAMKKTNKVLKYWFISLNDCYSENLATTFRFFEINLREKPKYVPFKIQPGQHYLVTNENLFCANLFRHNVHKSLNDPTFIEMLLYSKATKHSDRFHAILPLSKKYSHHRVDRNTVDSWNITDLVSVRMRLQQWLTTEENLDLLVTYFTISQDFGEIVSLPSFDVKRFINGRSYNYGTDNHHAMFLSGYQRNFGLDQSQPGVVMRDTVDGGLADETLTLQLRYSMHLFPKVYFSQKITLKDVSQFIRDSIWKVLQLDPSVDQISWARIPLFIPPNDQLENLKMQENTCSEVFMANMAHNILDLIGSSTKNVWIIINGCSRLLRKEYTRSSDEWTWCQREAGDVGLRVY